MSAKLKREGIIMGVPTDEDKQIASDLFQRASHVVNGDRENLIKIAELASLNGKGVASLLRRGNVTPAECHAQQKETLAHIEQMLSEIREQAIAPKTKWEATWRALRKMPLPVAVLICGPLTALVHSHAHEFTPLVKWIVKAFVSP